MPRPSKPFLDRFLVGLTDPEEAAAYLKAAQEDSDDMFFTALQDVARAHQVTKVAKQTGVAREHVYRSLAAQGNPAHRFLRRVLHTFGLKFDIVPEETGAKGSGQKPKVKRTTGYRPRRYSTRHPHTKNAAQLLLNFEPEPALLTKRLANSFSWESSNEGLNQVLSETFCQQFNREELWKRELPHRQRLRDSNTDPLMTLLPGMQTTYSSNQAFMT